MSGQPLLTKGEIRALCRNNLPLLKLFWEGAGQLPTLLKHQSSFDKLELASIVAATELFRLEELNRYLNGDEPEGIGRNTLYDFFNHTTNKEISYNPPEYRGVHIEYENMYAWMKNEAQFRLPHNGRGLEERIAAIPASDAASIQSEIETIETGKRPAIYVYEGPYNKMLARDYPLKPFFKILPGEFPAWPPGPGDEQLKERVRNRFAVGIEEMLNQARYREPTQPRLF